METSHLVIGVVILIGIIVLVTKKDKKKEMSETKVDIRQVEGLQDALDSKQGELVDGVSLKTINSLPLLGSGNIVIAGGEGSGETNTASNLGAGAGLFANKVATDLQFKSLVAGTGISLTPTTNTVVIASTAEASGEVNTGSNRGTGEDVFVEKIGTDLQFKTVKAGAGILLTSNDDELTITNTADALGEANTAENLGGGTPLYDSKVGASLRFRSLLGGTGISISSVSGGATTITNTNPGEANTAANLGTGTGVYGSKVGAELRFKSIKAGTNIAITSDSTSLTINSTAGGGGSNLPIVNVMDFGADDTGITNNVTAFNSAVAAAAGNPVYVPAGTFLLNSATSNGYWWLAPGAVITGLSNTGSGANNISRLTGRVFKMENTASYRGTKFGSTGAWLETTYWGFADGIAELSAISKYSGIGVMGASRTSDDPSATMGSIGLGGFSVNDATGAGREPAWGAYINHQRVSGAGASYGLEIDNVNRGDTLNLTPYNTGVAGLTNNRTVNLWLTCGGGGDGLLGVGNAVSAAMAIAANPTAFNRGIVFPQGCVNGTISEVITSFNGGRIAWYDVSGSERRSGYITSAGAVSGLDFVARNFATNVEDIGLRLDGQNACLRPLSDNAIRLGIPGARYSNVHSAIVTTDHVLLNSGTPGSLANGMFWFDGAALKVRIAGVTRTVTVT